MKHKRGKMIAAITAVVLLGGVTAFACANADKLSGMLGAVLGIEQEQGDTSAAAQGETPKTLEEYAKTLSCLKCIHYNGYLNESEETVFTYDMSQVPAGPLGYALEDFDEDGQKELLVITLQENDTLLASMYEQENDSVRLADQYDLGQDEMSLEVYMASKDARPALTECYLYGENDIGIERSELAELAADGVFLNFIALHYDGSKLEKKTRAYTAGSDLDSDTSFMDTLKTVGIQGLDWDKITMREKHVRDYVKNYRQICGVETTYLLSFEEFSDWMENPTQPLKCTDIYFYSEEELEKNTKTVQAAYQEPSQKTEQTDTQQQSAQEPVGEDWKQAYLAYIEEAHNENFSDELWNRVDFWLLDVNGDKIPELYINYGVTSAGSELCTYDGEKVNRVFMWESGLRYIKGANKAWDAGGHQGVYYDAVYTIKDGDFIETAKGEHTQGMGDGHEDEKTFTWDGQSRSEDEYQKKLNSFIDTEQAVWVFEDERESACDCNTIINAINQY